MNKVDRATKILFLVGTVGFALDVVLGVLAYAKDLV